MNVMNVIVICCDTLRADVVDHTWEDNVDTPNLDELRKTSTVFNNAWGEGEPTIPMRRGFFTGTRSYPWRFHVDDRGSVPNLHGWHAIPTEHTTTAEYLLPNGVATGLVADVYHMFKPTMNFTRGFVSYDYIRGQESDRVRSGPLSAIDMKPYLPDEIANPTDRPGIAQYLLNMLDRQWEEDYLAPRVFRSAAQWIQENYENQPFYLWIDSFTPHECWDPPMHFADRYFKADGVKDYIYPQMVQGYKQLTDDEIRRTKALYYGYVTFVDKWIGYLLEVITNLRLWDDTVIFFVSDHGTELMDKTMFGKSPNAMHPYNFRLNFWMRHPDPTFHGKTTDAYVQNTDLLPTTLALFGVEHEPVDGYNLLPIVSGEQALPRDHVITGWGETAAVRTPEWNLILNTVNENANPRLFNHVNDPKEENNVAADHPNVVGALQARLEALIGDSLPTTYTHKPTNRYNATFNQWTQSNLAR
jgi:arylsulfatase A-like enzyme